MSTVKYFLGTIGSASLEENWPVQCIYKSVSPQAHLSFDTNAVQCLKDCNRVIQTWNSFSGFVIEVDKSKQFLKAKSEKNDIKLNCFAIHKRYSLPTT